MNNMKISYVILYKDELQEIKQLLHQLTSYKDKEDEIVIVYDGNDDELEYTLLSYLITDIDNLIIECNKLDKDFANQRNYASKLCKGDYIMHIDADELFDNNFFANIKEVLSSNADIEVFGFPRVNIVNNITPADIAKWHWKVDANGYINFPDYQMRLYKNNKKIKWEGKVHEHLVAFDSITTFQPIPVNEIFFLQHVKDINRQRKQNALYETI